MAGFWENLFQGGTAAAGAYDQYNRITDLGQGVADDMTALGQQVSDASQFKPYTVSSGFGSSSVGPDGSTSSQLSSDWEAFQNQMRGMGEQSAQMGQGANAFLTGLAQDPSRVGASLASNYDELNGWASGAFSDARGAINNATGDLTSMRSGMYDELRGAMRPEEQRARIAMEERLRAQGRLGVGTSAYGGTPEALAMEKAIAEGRNNAWNQTFANSQQYQQNQLNTGLGLAQSGMAGNQLAQQLASMNVDDIAKLSQTGGALNSMGADAAHRYGTASMLPSSMMLDQLAAGANNSQLAQAGQLAGTGLMGQLGLGGIQVQANMEKIANEMLGGMWNNLAGVAGGIGTQVDKEGWGGLWESIFKREQEGV
jgi:hypothetical protein